MCECDQIAWRSRSTGRRQRAAMHVIWQQDIERQKLHRQSLATWLRIQGMQCHGGLGGAWAVQHLVPDCSC